MRKALLLTRHRHEVLLLGARYRIFETGPVIATELTELTSRLSISKAFVCHLNDQIRPFLQIEQIGQKILETQESAVEDRIFLKNSLFGATLEA